MFSSGTGTALILALIQRSSAINVLQNVKVVLLVILQVFFYSKSIFENAHVLPEYIPFAVMAANGVNVIMTLIAVRSL